MLAVTWNMMGRKPSRKEFEDLLKVKEIHHDIYIIGS